MSGKLDQSLDEILSSTRRAAGAGHRRSQRRSSGRPTPPAPVGGIQKNSKPARAAAGKAPPAKLAGLTGDSKIIVSNLPKDVNEAQIKEYFVNAVGPIKRVEISYGVNGQSRGIANVTFSRPDGASKAFQALNGLLVDNKPIKIEIVVSSAQAAAIPPPKSLSDRVSQPKPHPKSAATDKHGINAAKGGAPASRGRGGAARRGRGGRNPRPAKKTAEELDSEMADYFEGANNAENTNGVAAGATNGDAMVDETIG